MNVATPLVGRIRGVALTADLFLARFPVSITQLLLRVAVALPFWRSGQTKWEGWFQVSDGAVYLFSEEFRLHVFGQSFAYPFPEVTAFAVAAAETLLPILLVLGLGTRFAALGIVIMTGMIQLTVPQGWEAYHLPWAAMALAVMTYGPGRIALDPFLLRAPRFRRSA